MEFLWLVKSTCLPGHAQFIPVFSKETGEQTSSSIGITFAGFRRVPGIVRQPQAYILLGITCLKAANRHSWKVVKLGVDPEVGQYFVDGLGRLLLNLVEKYSYNLVQGGDQETGSKIGCQGSHPCSVPF